MEPKVVTRNEKKVIGIDLRTSNQLEVHQSTAQIPKAWSRFTSDQILEQIPNQAHPSIVLGVYTDYESDQNGKFSLIVGTEVTSLDDIPEGMTGITVPPAKYLEFNFEGKLPDVVTNAWQQIWKYFADNADYQRTFSTDFEVYDRKQPDKVDIFIAVK
jgi:predicted transcriptional regulator YdeE